MISSEVTAGLVDLWQIIFLSVDWETSKLHGQQNHMVSFLPELFYFWLQIDIHIHIFSIKEDSLHVEN